MRFKLNLLIPAWLLLINSASFADIVRRAAETPFNVAGGAVDDTRYLVTGRARTGEMVEDAGYRPRRREARSVRVIGARRNSRQYVRQRPMLTEQQIEQKIEILKIKLKTAPDKERLMKKIEYLKNKLADLRAQRGGSMIEEDMLMVDEDVNGGMLPKNQQPMGTKAYARRPY